MYRASKKHSKSKITQSRLKRIFRSLNIYTMEIKYHIFIHIVHFLVKNINLISTIATSIKLTLLGHKRRYIRDNDPKLAYSPIMISLSRFSNSYQLPEMMIAFGRNSPLAYCQLITKNIMEISSIIILKYTFCSSILVLISSLCKVERLICCD